MTARQFGFVVSRGLAIYCFANAIHYTTMTLSVVLLTEADSSSKAKFFTMGSIVLFLLMATILWTGADKFAGPHADNQPNLRSGNWAVRLTFTCFGIYLVILSINDLAPLLVRFFMPEAFRPTGWENYVYIGGGALKLLLGLGLFLRHRFDKAAVIQVAQSITERPKQDLPSA